MLYDSEKLRQVLEQYHRRVSGAPSKAHQDEVERVVRFYLQMGWRVWADLPGLQKPPNIGGFIPDVYAVKETRTAMYQMVAEVETVDSVYDEHSREQHAAFRTWADEDPLHRKYHLRVVP